MLAAMIEAKPKPHQKPKRGRPAKPVADQVVRQALMDAGSTCFTEKSYRSVTIRELADAANTSSAMIRYYFGNKEGLLAAMIERVAQQSIKTLPQKVQQADTSLPAILELLVSNLVNTHYANPWLARLLVDEVLSGNLALREMFEQRLAGTGMAVIKAGFLELQQQGKIRQDLNVNHVMASLVSLCVFPFLAQPIFDNLLDTDVRGMEVTQWINHTVALLQRGLEPLATEGTSHV